MKLFKKLIFALIMVFALFTLVGCGVSVDDGTHKVINKDETINVGILQIATHGALDLTREGFLEALKKAGFEDNKNIKVTVMNPEGDPNNLQLMAKKIVRSNDLVLAIATDAAKAVKTACENEDIRIPLLFTAVTDPVDAKLVESNENVGGRVTGTSDINPVKDQIALIKQMNPTIDKLGILYTINETNSLVQANLAKEQAKTDGLEVLEGAVTGATDITPVARDLIAKGAKVLYIPTDNNLAKNMERVKEVALEHKVPVICGEMDMVKKGGLITYGISYKTLGELTGEMAVKIFNGAQAKDLKVQSLTGNRCEKFVNMDILKLIESDNFKMPEAVLKDAIQYTEKNK